MTDPYYESRFTFDPSRSAVWREIVRYESRFLPDNAAVLDLGAGYCDFINNVSAEKKYAIDISPELSRFAAKDVTIIQRPGWNYNEIPGGSLDAIHASNFLEHFSDDDLEKIMAEIKRMLKPSGILLLMQPNYALSYKHYFDDYTHKKVFSDTSLEGFISSHGFVTILKKPRFLPFSMKSKPSVLPPALLQTIVRMYLNSPWKPFAGQMLLVARKDK